MASDYLQDSNFKKVGRKKKTRKYHLLRGNARKGLGGGTKSAQTQVTYKQAGKKAMLEALC